MDSSWKRIIYLICTIQVGGGITIIGVVSFIPLFLAELGLHDQGQAAMWAGIVSGVGQWAYTKRLWLWASSLDHSWVAL